MVLVTPQRRLRWAVTLPLVSCIAVTVLASGLPTLPLLVALALLVQLATIHYAHRHLFGIVRLAVDGTGPCHHILYKGTASNQPAVLVPTPSNTTPAQYYESQLVEASTGLVISFRHVSADLTLLDESKSFSLVPQDSVHPPAPRRRFTLSELQVGSPSRQQSLREFANAFKCGGYAIMKLPDSLGTSLSDTALLGGSLFRDVKQRVKKQATMLGPNASGYGCDKDGEWFHLRRNCEFPLPKGLSKGNEMFWASFAARAKRTFDQLEMRLLLAMMAVTEAEGHPVATLAPLVDYSQARSSHGIYRPRSYMSLYHRISQRSETATCSTGLFSIFAKSSKSQLEIFVGPNRHCLDLTDDEVVVLGGTALAHALHPSFRPAVYREVSLQTGSLTLSFHMKPNIDATFNPPAHNDYHEYYQEHHATNAYELEERTAPNPTRGPLSTLAHWVLGELRGLT